MPDQYDLARFVTAQAPVIAQALAELRRGAKSSHWMWFVFPQLAGLGLSPTARRFAISGLAEARAYLSHPVLGARLTDTVTALLSGPDDDPGAILGPIDAVKLRSSMTLFAAAGFTPANRVLDRFFGGIGDLRTAALLEVV